MADNIFKKENGTFTRQFPMSRAPSPLSSDPNAYASYMNSRKLPAQSPLSSDPNSYAGYMESVNPSSPTRTLPPQPQVQTQPQQQTPLQQPQQPPQQPPQPPQQPQTNPYDNFNLLLQDALKTAQGLDDKDLLKQYRTLQRESIDRSRGQGITTPSAEELKFLSPSQQASMRGADVGALSTDLDEIAYQITGINNERKDLIEQIQFARESGDKSRAAALDAEYKQKDEEYRQATLELDRQQLSETIRGNKANEGITRDKNKAATGETSGYLKQLASTGREAVVGLYTLAEANPSIFGRTAAAPIPDMLRSGPYRDYVAQLDYLKGNIIPAALSAMREASKTGGAVGQLSDKEGAWFASSLGALDMRQEPETILKQLKLVDSHLKNWETGISSESAAAQILKDEYGITVSGVSGGENTSANNDPLGIR